MSIRYITSLALLLVLGACASGSSSGPDRETLDGPQASNEVPNDVTPPEEPKSRVDAVPTETRITLPESLGDLETVQVDGPFPVHVGESVLLEPIGLAFTFVEVSEESRCPVDGSVNCFWEGFATVVVRAALTDDGLTEEIALHTTDTGNWSRSGEILGHTIRLDQLEPYPTGAGLTFTPPDPDSYLALFSIIE